MDTRLTQEHIDHARSTLLWDFGNRVLYDLCRRHPEHRRKDVIIAKIWLIGRSYAAAIERGKRVGGTSDSFYETRVADTILKSDIDKWLKEIPSKITKPWQQLSAVVTVHKQLTDLFHDMTELNKRSLASKYLHFHRPDAFFIFDSRANKAIRKVTPPARTIECLETDEADHEYYNFVRRCQWLRDDVNKRLRVILTPRQVDKILLFLPLPS